MTCKPDSNSSATFSLFPQLPPELRLRIWKHSLACARIVPIQCGPGDTLGTSGAIVSRIDCATTIPNPAALSICTESRAEAIKSYRRRFGFFGQPGRIYFDPSCDVLYFGPRQGCMAAHAQFRTCMALCDTSDLHALRRIAISDALFWIGDTYCPKAAANMALNLLDMVNSSLPNLEELVFVPRPEDEEPDHVNHALQRIHEQVNAAIHELIQEHLVEWRVPVWRVTTLRGLYDACG